MNWYWIQKSWNSGNTWELPRLCFKKGQDFTKRFEERSQLNEILSKCEMKMMQSHSILLLKSPAVIYFQGYFHTDVVQHFSTQLKFQLWSMWKKFTKCLIINLDMV